MDPLRGTPGSLLSFLEMNPERDLCEYVNVAWICLVFQIWITHTQPQSWSVKTCSTLLKVRAPHAVGVRRMTCRTPSFLMSVVS